jgi:hypothetical protein
MEHAWSLFERQERKCAISGEPLIFEAGRNSRTTASLDRVDNTKGYVPGNVQWVHKVVNLMRNALPVSEFTRWCALIAEHTKNSSIRGG